ncbi:hypothetical protein SNEBB_002873 [Seison nebaliae]|nr:hypothetical protein SNEBB_002873 [Seison nebaliae]
MWRLNNHFRIHFISSRQFRKIRNDEYLGRLSDEKQSEESDNSQLEPETSTDLDETCIENEDEVKLKLINEEKLLLKSQDTSPQINLLPWFYKKDMKERFKTMNMMKGINLSEFSSIEMEKSSQYGCTVIGIEKVVNSKWSPKINEAIYSHDFTVYSKWLSLMYYQMEHKKSLKSIRNHLLDDHRRIMELTHQLKSDDPILLRKLIELILGINFNFIPSSDQDLHLDRWNDDDYLFTSFEVQRLVRLLTKKRLRPPIAQLEMEMKNEIMEFKTMKLCSIEKYIERKEMMSERQLFYKLKKLIEEIEEF